DFPAVFWLAVVPASGAVALLVIGVREPEAADGARHPRQPIAFRDIKRLTAGYWWVVGVGALMTLARFSEAFLVLRAQSVGMAFAWVPSVMVLMSLAYALVAY